MCLLWVIVVMCLVPICHVGVLPTLVSCWFRFALFVLVGIALCWCRFRVDVSLVSFRFVLCWRRFAYVCCCVLLPDSLSTLQRLLLFELRWPDRARHRGRRISLAQRVAWHNRAMALQGNALSALQSATALTGRVLGGFGRELRSRRRVLRSRVGQLCRELRSRRHSF